MAPKRYKPLDECRDAICKYINRLSTSENSRSEGSITRYKQDLRWLDGWLDDEGFDEVTDITSAGAEDMMIQLSTEFSGTTPRYRWDRIFAFFEWLERREQIPSNPLRKWDSEKGEYGLTKSTQQSEELGDDENYAVSQDDVRKMEKHCGEPKIRNQLIIRMMWQTGMRRGEMASLTRDMIHRDAREIHLPPSVTKNSKKRIIGYQESLDGLLRSYIDGGLRDESLAGRETEKVFIGVRGGNLRGEAINEVIRKAADNAGINRKLEYEPANGGSRWLITSHNVRHGFASHLVNNTEAGLWEVSRQLGHSSVKITEETYVEDEPDAGLEHIKRYGPD